MSIAVRNESSGMYIVGVGAQKRVISPGQATTLSDWEWEHLADISKGPGLMNPLYPTSGNQSNALTKFDYFQEPNGNTFQMRWMGKTDEIISDSTNAWTIYQYDYVVVNPAANPIDVRISRIQVLDAVAWANRATLGWTP